MVSVSHSGTFPLIKIPLLRSNEINRDFNMFTDQLLPQELSSLVRIMRLFGIRLPKSASQSESESLNQREPGIGEGTITHFGALVELSCTLLSFPSLSTILNWSPLHTLITVPSKFFELAPENPFVFDAAGVGKFASK